MGDAPPSATRGDAWIAKHLLNNRVDKNVDGGLDFCYFSQELNVLSPLKVMLSFNSPFLWILHVIQSILFWYFGP